MKTVFGRAGDFPPERPEGLKRRDDMQLEQCVLFPFEEIKKGSRIVLYGAGDVGQAFYCQLNRKKYCEVVGWLDREWNDRQQLVHPYIGLRDLDKLRFDTIIIAVNNTDAAAEIRENLISRGVPDSKIYFSEDYLVRYPLKKIVPQSMGTDGAKSNKDILKGKENRRLKIGFLAVSSIAKTMAETICAKVQEAEIAAVASRSLDKARQFAGQFQIDRAYGNYEDMLEDETIELVYISSPARMHYEHVMLCLKHGKHVICEKPFAMNYREAKEMLDCAAERKCFISDGLWTAYLPMAKKISEIAESGIIGKISTVCANQHYYAGPGGRHRSRELGGSAVLDMGIYLLAFAGLAIKEQVKGIHATGWLRDGVDEQAAIILQYDDKMALLSCGMNAASDRMGGIYGDQGYILIQDANEYKRLELHDQDGSMISEINMLTGYEYEVKACIQAIQSGKLETEERSHEIILSSMQMADQIREKIGAEG